MGKLTGRVAVVTGASKGIGAAIATSLAAEGASVIVNYATSRAAAEATVSAITGTGGKAVAVGGDVSKAADAERLIEDAIERFGRLDILVNNSGVWEFAAIEEFTEESFHKQFDINVLGVLLTTRAAVRYLGAGGSIINIGSAGTTMTPPETVVYTASKAAVDAITRVLAKELGPRGIRVNSVNPGLVATPGTAHTGVLGSDLEKTFVGSTPLGRVGLPEDIAAVALFLASDDAGWLTGEHVLAAGGMR
ncbi:glucose 1-dehydrogenase [Actinoallomurus acanthiterrae]